MSKETLDKRKYFVARIKHCVAKSFITRFHYAKGAPLTSCMCFGLFDKEKSRLVGANIFMTAPYAVANKFNEKDLSAVLTLSRLAIKPNAPKNSASFLIGKSIKLIKNQKRWTHLVTYADERLEHKGIIYKATNWTYDGMTEPQYSWIDKEGKMVSKYAFYTKSNAEMDKLYTRVGPYQKHRFYMDISK